MSEVVEKELERLEERQIYLSAQASTLVDRAQDLFTERELVMGTLRGVRKEQIRVDAQVEKLDQFLEIE